MSFNFTSVTAHVEAEMKLILLPGMDGTGLLFQDVLAKLDDIDTLVVALPQRGPQDYEVLSEYVSGLLPDEDYLVLAESFSGGIAALLSRVASKNMRGIIFVASFLSSPMPLLVELARFLPLKLLVSLPFSSFIIRSLLLGWSASSEQIARFKSAVVSVPTVTLKSRLSIIARSRYNGFRAEIPAVYIGASRDIFVGSRTQEEFVEAYPGISFVEIDGPHFLLQAKPEEAAIALHNAMAHLISA